MNATFFVHHLAQYRRWAFGRVGNQHWLEARLVAQQPGSIARTREETATLGAIRFIHASQTHEGRRRTVVTSRGGGGDGLDRIVFVKLLPEGG